MPKLILLPDQERSLLRRHPWVYADAVGRLEGKARPGDTVEVLADDLRLLGRAAYSPNAHLRARMWSFDPAESIDDAFIKRQVARSVARRQHLAELRNQEGVRLIHAESDGLPGVIADRYADTLVLQLTSAGADKWRNALVAGLMKSTGCDRVYERSDSDLRALEGLSPQTGWLAGTPPSEPLTIREHAIRLVVDYMGGHKTGFYLDQRDNRRLLGELVAGKSVLNCFCYTGAFSLQALSGGADRVVSIDSSGPALEQARGNLARNPQLPAARAEWLEADVFEALRQFRREDRRFDVIILDPPKFAPSSSHAGRAARAYKDINMLGFRLLKPGGLLMTYSCSGAIGIELFQKIIAGAAVEAERDARILRRLAGAADHPVGLSFPEGEYLKGLLVLVD